MFYTTIYLMIGLVLFMAYKGKMQDALENEMSHLLDDSIEKALHKILLVYALAWPIVFTIDYFTIFRKK